MFEHIDHHEIFGSFMRYLSTYSSLSSLNCHKKKNTYQNRPRRKPENTEWKSTKIKEKQNKTTNNQWHAQSQQTSKPDHRESTIRWRILCMKLYYQLTLSWRRSLSYRNHSIDLRSKSMDWFLYDNSLRHERVKSKMQKSIGPNVKRARVSFMFTTLPKMTSKWN